ncbi:hypothetical protein Sango_2721700 [Sesamum angolense]|uniref:Integrase catalytic domain-containing protein n=1 Tax=Sesamum angolense TaxID=2727404 RepID=A0AAE1T972_9LAMI|nr:hypothetical protein Sango_2721700 [Sesamum angolense]
MLSNVICLESSGLHGEARQNILGISLDENDYVLDKSLHVTMSEGSTPEERVASKGGMRTTGREASTSKAKGKGARRWKRKKGKTKAAASALRKDVCGPLNTQARDRFSYFITFTNDHSWYGYVYLMRYKSEVFGRFKEFKLEVENQTNRKFKALGPNRGGEYLSGEFLDYLKENEILSQWIPPRTPQLNCISERRNRTLLDMVRS